LPGSTARDEIGDLARSFSSVVARLGAYATDREALASRLSHELRTPLAIVRSSLDNLRQTPTPPGAQVYLERAQDGLDRLTRILARMSEAARLEHALLDTERMEFDLAAVVAACVEGYRAAYPQRQIAYEPPGAVLPMRGAPDLVAQMLDKLVANAMEFATADPVTVALADNEGTALLAVSNEGPPLPAGMAGRLFDAMVSVRSGGGASDEPHLGLGLYIVRLVAEFHRGTASADNRTDGRGVVITVTLPLAGAGG
jgi:signal transduction histidine kinase